MWRAAWIALVVAAGAGCLGDDSEFPEDGYFDGCTAHEDCSGEWTCLEWRGWGGSQNVCTRSCAGGEACPRVSSDHCGDSTWCHEGVCGYQLCR